jgi:hypothetical protein
MSIKEIYKKIFATPAYGKYMPGLLFIWVALPGAEAQDHVKKGVAYSMTVLTVRQPNMGEKYMSVVFQKSQRAYKLSKSANARYIELLRESAKTHVPVLVTRASEASDTIVSVERVR